ncbi:MAG: SWI/SNF complex component snf12 [Trichoglossum hirsutum]|nr:MAG: SWI/SNF complex component snf12 [Trichoglossum hirsutum]
MASVTRRVPGTPRVISPSPTPSDSGDQTSGGYFGPITRSASKRVVSPSAIDEENEVDGWNLSDSSLERSRTRSRSPVIEARRRRKSGYTAQKPVVSRKDGETVVANGKTNGHLVPPRTISSYWRDLSRSPSPLGLIPIHRHWRSFVHRHEVPRKALHLSIGFFTLYLYANGTQTSAIHPLLLTALIPIAAVDYLRHHSPSFNRFYIRVLGALMRESEVDGWNGVIWYLLGAWIVLRFFPKDVGVMGVLLLSWCDTAASTFGRLFGRYTPRIRRGKSLAGSLAACLVGVATAATFWGWLVPSIGSFPADPPNAFMFTGKLALPASVRGLVGFSEGQGILTGTLALWVMSLWTGLVGAASEVVDLWGWDDNLTIPVLSGVGIWGFLKVFSGGDSLSSTNHKFPATLPSVLIQNITIGNCQDSSSRSHIKCNHDEKKFSSENEDHQKLRRQGARRQLELDRRRDVQCRTFGLAIRMLERGRLNKRTNPDRRAISMMNTPMQQQYRGHAQHTPVQRSPHNPPIPRRGPGPMISSSHPQPSLTAAQMQAQQQAAAQERELAKRRSRKPTDKNIPDGVEDVIVGDGVKRYRELREVERKLDAAMMRKRLDIQDSVNRNVKRYKTMRIWISNTAENQPWQTNSLDENAFDFSTGIEATYKVKIEGRLLDDEDDEEPSDSGDSDDEKEGDAMDEDDAETKLKEKARPSTPASQPRKKLPHFFKSITVELDRPKTLQSDGTTQIEWKKPSHQANAPNPPLAGDFDCLEFERKSDENINCTINLVRDENPERHRLSKELAEVLDTDEETRAGVVMGIWEYVKTMGLQEDEEKRGVKCDERLAAIFKQETVYFPQIPDLILSHLSPLPPLQLPYTIRVDPHYHTSTPHPEPTIYDVPVPLDDPLRTKMATLITSPTYPLTLRTLTTLDDQLSHLVQAIAHSKAKHGFFSAMARDPVGFVRRWVGSQRRDLEVILGEATRGGGEDGGGEEWRRGGQGGVWGSEGVRESVGLWLAKGGR